MFTYVIRRTLQAIPLLFLVSVLLFVIVNNAPGGPLGPYLQNPHITAADIARLKHNLGLDQPQYVQYLHWLWNSLHLQFGYSTSNSADVTAAILERVPATLELTVTSLSDTTVNPVAGTEPKSTALVLDRPDPVIVTYVPPELTPEVGETRLTIGGGAV